MAVSTEATKAGSSPESGREEGAGAGREVGATGTLAMITVDPSDARTGTGAGRAMWTGIWNGSVISLRSMAGGAGRSSFTTTEG